MHSQLQQITFEEWERKYPELQATGMRERAYGGPMSRHVEKGDTRLCKLAFDPSPESLRLWNFLLSEEDRLHAARYAGKKIIGTMKDLGTIPVMAYALPDTIAFYPDGAWWIPCVMEHSQACLEVADSLGIPESFCPVRAMLGAFLTEAHFPIPDLLVCSTGATCDDFSAIAQRLESLGFPILWWEIPYRRHPEEGEAAVALPGGFNTAASLVSAVKEEFERIQTALEETCGHQLTETMLAAGIARVNNLRGILAELRRLVFSAPVAPLPALELLIAEMFAIHYCSDLGEATDILESLLSLVKKRIASTQGYFAVDAVKLFWINPVADLRLMNSMEQCGGRICGTDYLFFHALDLIPEDIPPVEALARMALADQMVGSTTDRADRVCREIRRYGSEAVVISRIPGASHCAVEGTIIAESIRARLSLPVIEIEVPSVSDAMLPGIITRLQALVETVQSNRGK